MDNIGKRPTLKAPVSPKTNAQEKMKEFMKNKRKAGLDTILNSITSLFEENEKLKQQLRDYSKDDEIKKLEDELHKLRMDTLHTLTSTEKFRATEFRNEHYAKCKGNTRYILLGTGIGTATTLECTKCGEQENITDYEGW
ncbi:hypothetical protein pW2_36 [Bacillus phage pW2]|uniref:Uncharacterized protein n=1 Tax=Bacillus phage pW2 TaxID=2500559 RepID=A0A3Q9R7M1_9CAUD|nr:hypothetical protein PQE69_gp021 [Bacillus phage pW2]AZU98874.1 hypothetical protein pW2_36 [Bacillus phage pW2]